MLQMLKKYLNKKNITCGLLYIFATMAFTQPLQISLFNDKALQSAYISLLNEDFYLFADSVLITKIETPAVFYMQYEHDHLLLITEDKKEYKAKTFLFENKVDSAMFKIRPVNPAIDYRVYEGGLFIKHDYNRFYAINHISPKYYLAGVLQAECGYNKHIEFYKAHAVISRTYLYKSIDKHINEGFHLCDGVHCQAYKGWSNETNIQQAVNETDDTILSFYDTTLVAATYFSNCGGQTDKASNVWLNDEPYLTSVSCNYCSNGRNYSWERKISLHDWKKYLTSQGINCDLLNDEQLLIIQTQRQRSVKINQRTILLRKVREDWNLKSAFFTMQLNGNMITIRGKGYGHGVGLCQEGAMEMAKQNFNYKDIIHFYYQQITIDSYTIFKEKLLQYNQLKADKKLE
jgi:stage II sporulation protein D